MSSTNQTSSLVCRRYAGALLQQAETDQVLPAVEKDIKDLAAMLTASADLRAAIRSPLLSGTSMDKALEKIADKAGFQTSTKNFLRLLARNGRLNALEKMIKAFTAALAEKRGEQSVDIQVAQDLSPQQKKELQAALSKALNGNVSINVRVEPALLGGMIVTVGSRMIDDSVARKLNRLQTAMGAQAA